jgi:hypothetical protein
MPYREYKAISVPNSKKPDLFSLSKRRGTKKRTGGF